MNLREIYCYKSPRSHETNYAIHGTETLKSVVILMLTFSDNAIKRCYHVTLFTLDYEHK